MIVQIENVRPELKKQLSVITEENKDDKVSKDSLGPECDDE
jgi:hypothetical protein